MRIADGTAQLIALRSQWHTQGELEASVERLSKTNPTCFISLLDAFEENDPRPDSDKDAYSNSMFNDTDNEEEPDACNQQDTSPRDSDTEHAPETGHAPEISLAYSRHTGTTREGIEGNEAGEDEEIEDLVRRAQNSQSSFVPSHP